jgi:hypothetical protein
MIDFFFVAMIVNNATSLRLTPTARSRFRFQVVSPFQFEVASVATFFAAFMLDRNSIDLMMLSCTCSRRNIQQGIISRGRRYPGGGVQDANKTETGRQYEGGKQTVSSPGILAITRSHVLVFQQNNKPVQSIKVAKHI